MLANPAYGQNVASIDLTHPAVSTNSAKQPLPKGCEKLLPGIMADGYVAPPDSEPREIVVEIVNVRQQNLVVGSAAQGEVQLRNTGKYPIQIPWSTDRTLIEKNQDPNHLTWEEGAFNFVLRGTGPLKQVEQSLYGSTLVVGSRVTIRPGEWVTAEVTFKLELEYPFLGQVIKQGEGQLRVEWEQGQYSRDIKECRVGSGYYRYANYYRQQNPAITIRLN